MLISSRSRLTRWLLTSIRRAWLRATRAAAVISSSVSPFIRRAVRKDPTSTGGAAPFNISSMAAFISDSERFSRLIALVIACLIMIVSSFWVRPKHRGRGKCPTAQGNKNREALGDGLAVSGSSISSGGHTSPQETRHHQFRAAEMILCSIRRCMALTYCTPDRDVKQVIACRRPGPAGFFRVIDQDREHSHQTTAVLFSGAAFLRRNALGVFAEKVPMAFLDVGVAVAPRRGREGWPGAGF